MDHTLISNHIVVENELAKLRSVEDLVQILMEGNFLEGTLGRQKLKQALQFIRRTDLAAGKLVIFYVTIMNASDNSDNDNSKLK